MISSVPHVTREQMIEVDRLMVEEAGITLLQMMENAGRSLADFVMQRHRPNSVTVFVGRGGNGGGGLVASRHLSNRGVNVTIVTSSEVSKFDGVPAIQLGALAMTDVSISDAPPATADLVVDALIGYSLSGAPRGRVRDLIVQINQSVAPVVSLDVPSGVDPDTGDCEGTAVRATSTLTLALPKIGLRDSQNTGSQHLADISVPPSLYRRLGIEVPSDLFSESQVIELS